MGKTQITPFGRVVRKHRIDQGMLLKDMAEALGISSSWLSAIETGRKPITKGLPKRVAKVLGLDLEETADLLKAAEQSAASYSIKSAHPERRDVAAALARRFDHLSDEDIDRIREIVSRSRA